MIYFMQPIGGGPVKIGFSDDVNARRQQLESHYRQQLAVLATMEGGREEERAMHGRFAHLRLGRTEQFRPAFELMEFIGRPLLVGANPDAVEAMAGRSLNGKLIRVSDAFAEAMRKATSFEQVSVAEFADMHLLPVVERHYRDAVIREAKRMEDKGR